MRTKMIKIVAAVSILVLLSMAFNYPDETPSKNYPMAHSDNEITLLEMNPCSMENASFQGEELLSYKIYYNWHFIWLPAGEVLFKVTDEGDQYHLSAKGRTYPSYEWFFKVRDNYDTYIDKNSLLPTTAIRDVKEGGYSLYDKVTFDQERQKTVSLRGDNKEKTIMREFDVDACMHDILSIIYYTRNVDFNSLDEGQEFPIKIFMDKEVWPLKVRYKGKDPKTKVKGTGHFKTIRFSPEVIIGDVFTEDAEMNIWATDDDNKIPVLIESPVSVGSVKAVLSGYANLRYPMVSKVE